MASAWKSPYGGKLLQTGAGSRRRGQARAERAAVRSGKRAEARAALRLEQQS